MKRLLLFITPYSIASIGACDECLQMYTLWTVTVDGGEGREKYGEDYADIFAINRLHYKAASPLECDHVSLAT